MSADVYLFFFRPWLFVERLAICKYLFSVLFYIVIFLIMVPKKNSSLGSALALFSGQALVTHAMDNDIFISDPANSLQGFG